MIYLYWPLMACTDLDLYFFMFLWLLIRKPTSKVNKIYLVPATYFFGVWLSGGCHIISLVAARWSFGLSSACIFCEIANCCIEAHLIHCCPQINTNGGIYSIHISVSLKFLNIFFQICDHNKYIIRYMCPNKKMSEESFVGDKINGFDFFCISPNFSYICTYTGILILSISYLGKHSVLFGLYYPSLQFNRF